MTTNTTKRVPYGFKLNFPAKFTVQQLVKLKNHEVSYITLYKRVQKALDAGIVEPDPAPGPLHPSHKGRRQIVYLRTNAKFNVFLD